MIKDEYEKCKESSFRILEKRNVTTKEMEDKLIISILVNNCAGVLLRIAGLFSRRVFNITSIAASETEDSNFTRITIVTAASKDEFRQIQMQLLKLEDVKKVILLTQENSTAIELLLMKVNADEATRQDVLNTIVKYGARVRDIGSTTMTVELTGFPIDIDRFVADMSAHGIAELARTGVTALERGDTTIKSSEY